MKLSNGNISHRAWPQWARMLACYTGVALALILVALAIIGF